MSNKLTIGRLARQSGVNVETIRYYQRIGLINQPTKPAQGYREYPKANIDRIQFIKRAKILGFSLQEIGELLSLGESSCEDAREKAMEKRNRIEQQIHELKQLRANLDDLILACADNKQANNCPMIDALKS